MGKGAKGYRGQYGLGFVTRSRDRQPVRQPLILVGCNNPLAGNVGPRLEHIGRVQVGRVGPEQPLLGGIELSWWTDDPTLSKEALGLQSALSRCDRTEYHFMAAVSPLLSESPWPAPMVEPWTDFRRDLQPEFGDAISGLEFGRSPRNWWISRYPIEWAEYGR